MTDDALIDLLLELQSLDRVPRMGYLLRGVDRPESVSEHSFHVAFLVWALAGEIPAVDGARAVEIALVHDLAEARLGDLPMSAAAYLPTGAKAAAETAAGREMLAPLAPRALERLHEYQEGVTAEARLVKACDKLQLMVKVAAYERRGEAGLGEFWTNEANFPDGGFRVVRRLFDELRRRRDPARTQPPPSSG